MGGEEALVKKRKKGTVIINEMRNEKKIKINKGGAVLIEIRNRKP